MDRYKKGKQVSYIIIAGNFLLAILKIGVGIFVGSSALIADGFHSFSDVISTGGVLIALYVSRRPPDKKHHYGHGQAEPIAAKLIGIILLLTGGILAYNTTVNLIYGEFEVLSLFGFWAALISILVKELMFRYSYRVGKETDNQSLKADAWHHRSDALSSVAAAIGVLGSYLGFPFLDPIAGLVVAVLILKVGWDIITEAVNSLLTISPESEKLSQIKRLVYSVDGVEDIAELKAHYSGGDLFIDIKIRIDYSLTVMEGHQISVRVKERLSRKFPETKEALVHVDPMMIKGNNGEDS